MKMLFCALFSIVLLIPRVSLSAEPELAGHWKLDDKEGEAAVDSLAAKNHGRSVGQPGRTMGKVGGALAFNGKDSYVEIPNSKELETARFASSSKQFWAKTDFNTLNNAATDGCLRILECHRKTNDFKTQAAIIASLLINSCE